MSWCWPAKLLHHRSNRADNAEALRLLDRADRARSRLCARARLEGLHARPGLGLSWCADRDATGAALTQELHTAQALDDNDSDVHRILAGQDARDRP